jgi:adenylate cyclase class IV
MESDFVEVEYKFVVDDLAALTLRLNEIAELVREREYQQSVMFDNPAKLMQHTDGRIRVRTLGEKENKELTYNRSYAVTDIDIKEGTFYD